jgi:hypothetical protein
MKFGIFLDVAPCSHHHHQGDESSIPLMMEVVRTSETSVNFNVTTRRDITKYSKLQIYFIALF